MSEIIVTACGINQLYYEARDENMPELVGLGLSPEGARDNLAKCRDDLNYGAIRMMMEMETEEEQL